MKLAEFREQLQPSLVFLLQDIYSDMARILLSPIESLAATGAIDNIRRGY